MWVCEERVREEKSKNGFGDGGEDLKWGGREKREGGLRRGEKVGG